MRGYIDRKLSVNNLDAWSLLALILLLGDFRVRNSDIASSLVELKMNLIVILIELLCRVMKLIIIRMHLYFLSISKFD